MVFILFSDYSFNVCGLILSKVNSIREMVVGWLYSNILMSYQWQVVIIKEQLLFLKQIVTPRDVIIDLDSESIIIQFSLFCEFWIEFKTAQQAKLPIINVDSRLRSQVETTLMGGCEVKLETS